MAGKSDSAFPLLITSSFMTIVGGEQVRAATRSAAPECSTLSLHEIIEKTQTAKTPIGTRLRTPVMTFSLKNRARDASSALHRAGSGVDAGERATVVAAGRSPGRVARACATGPAGRPPTRRGRRSRIRSRPNRGRGPGGAVGRG